MIGGNVSTFHALQSMMKTFDRLPCFTNEMMYYSFWIYKDEFDHGNTGMVFTFSSTFVLNNLIIIVVRCIQLNTNNWIY